jgi:tryptophanyl-tRNA synthetase
MGLDGVNKMSKSLDNHIELASSPEEIERRVMTMVTDPQRRYRTDPGRPEVCNVFAFHGFFSPEEVEGIEGECRSAGVGCVDCKRALARNLAQSLAPFREKREEIARDPDLVWEILRDGAARASLVAQETMAEVKQKVGLP